MDNVAWYNGTRLHSALGYRKPRLVRQGCRWRHPVPAGGVLRILELVGVLHVLRIYSDLAVASAAVTEAAV
jgi:hypothetical protein